MAAKKKKRSSRTSRRSRKGGRRRGDVVRRSSPYFSGAAGVGHWGYAIKIDGIVNSFPELPIGRQMDGYQAVEHFKKTAKTDWIGTKARDGKRPLAEVKKWIKAVQPSQFYARWPTDVNDDSVQIWYT